MTDKKEIPSGSITKKGAGVINRDVFVFVFFLFLSFIFWYLNSLGKEIEAEIRYPINYTNLPEKMLIVEGQPAKMDLSLKGPGYVILKLRLASNRTPIEIDLSKVSYKRVAGSKEHSYFIITSGISKNLPVKLRSECEITAVKPDTLFFTLKDKETESVPVSVE